MPNDLRNMIVEGLNALDSTWDFPECKARRVGDRVLVNLVDHKVTYEIDITKVEFEEDEDDEFCDGCNRPARYCGCDEEYDRRKNDGISE